MISIQEVKLFPIITIQERKNPDEYLTIRKEVKARIVPSICRKSSFNLRFHENNPMIIASRGSIVLNPVILFNRSEGASQEVEA
jgi:hypothetical protein